MNLDFFLNGDEIRKYWNNESNLFQNHSDICSNLPGSNNLVSLLSGKLEFGEWTEQLPININASYLGQDGIHQQFISVDLKTARSCFNNDFTLCFGDLSDSIQEIHQLKLKAAEIFGYIDLIAVTGYLSPPKTIGVLHYDRQHNFFIQKEGIKRWFISEKAATRNPYENLVYTGLPQSFFDDMNRRGYKILLPRDCGQKVFDLKPGDILYVPPGFYHSPETLNELSLHYTLTIEPACFWRDFNKDIFSKLLLSNGSYFKDYRFLSEQEKQQLFKSCIEFLDLQHK